MPTDIVLFGALLLGVAANFLSLIVWRRLSANGSLLGAIFAAFGIGGMLTAAFALWVLIGARSVRPGEFGENVRYFSASTDHLCLRRGIVIFAVINLGETSLRIRMLGKLMDSPSGMSRNDLVTDYNDRALLDIRLRRLREKGQAKFVDGTYYSRSHRCCFLPQARCVCSRQLYTAAAKPSGFFATPTSLASRRRQ